MTKLILSIVMICSASAAAMHSSDSTQAAIANNTSERARNREEVRSRILSRLVTDPEGKSLKAMPLTEAVIFMGTLTAFHKQYPDEGYDQLVKIFFRRYKTAQAGVYSTVSLVRLSQLEKNINKI